jgi:hypothetical protein
MDTGLKTIWRRGRDYKPHFPENPIALVKPRPIKPMRIDLNFDFPFQLAFQPATLGSSKVAEISPRRYHTDV